MSQRISQLCCNNIAPSLALYCTKFPLKSTFEDKRSVLYMRKGICGNIGMRLSGPWWANDTQTQLGGNFIELKVSMLMIRFCVHPALPLDWELSFEGGCPQCLNSSKDTSESRF